MLCEVDSIINPRRACAGGLWLSCLFFCLSVTTLIIVRFYGLPKVFAALLGFSSFLTRGFSGKPFIGKLWGAICNEQLTLSTGFSPFRVLCIHQ